MPSFSLLLISGSLRDGSTNTAVLRTAVHLAPADLSASLYERLGGLPHFNPDDDAEGAVPHPEVAELRRAVRMADALLICTPEYAGALPGSLKNLLEWTIGDAGTYDKPVAWINAAGPAAPTGASAAHASLRSVLDYAGADVVESACRRIPVTRADLDSAGRITGEPTRQAISAVIDALLEHVARRSERSRGPDVPG
ncbi:MAG: NADPH-dependent reductase [Solirubrobacterales bacterium]|nr:NADPH-dependent reductase [Solirubrobacterales bacterium]